MRNALWLLQRLAFLPRLAKFDGLRLGKRDGFLSIGPNIHFFPGMRLHFGKRVTLSGNGAFIGGGDVEIGDRTYIGHFFTINSGQSIHVGKYCMIANHVSLVDNEHGMRRDALMRVQPVSSRPIVIEDNVWLAEKVTVLGGVTIGTGSVVAAGSIVNHDVPPNTLVAGAPARFVRRLQ